MAIQKRSTIQVNIDDSVLIGIAKLNIFVSMIDSGVVSLIHGLLKVDYDVGTSITAELGNRDVEYILKSLAHQLQADTEFEKDLNQLLIEVSDLRLKRNALIHSHIQVNTSGKSISWFRTSAKGRLKHNFSKMTYEELDDLIQHAQNLIGDVLFLHRKIGAIW